MKLINMINFAVLGDERGSLIALENENQIPFTVKRVYYLYGMQRDVPRGFHAHKALRQLAICVSGSCDMLMDNGTSKETITLNCASKGIMIEPLQWHEMHNFSEDCVLMVLASEPYDETDYIRDYREFLNLIAKVG